MTWSMQALMHDLAVGQVGVENIKHVGSDVVRWDVEITEAVSENDQRQKGTGFHARTAGDAQMSQRVNEIRANVPQVGRRTQRPVGFQNFEDGQTCDVVQIHDRGSVELQRRQLRPDADDDREAVERHPAAAEVQLSQTRVDGRHASLQQAWHRNQVIAADSERLNAVRHRCQRLPFHHHPVHPQHS